MKKLIIFVLSVCIIQCYSISSAQETIVLPAPRIRGQVMKSLEKRVSFKGFSDKSLSLKEISDVLWAGFGVNDPNTGRRTAASAFNAQEIDIYVFLQSGVFQYDAHEGILVGLSENDLRGHIAQQDYAVNAPMHLLYVADLKRSRAAFMGSYKEQVHEMGYFHAGLITQNVYLYCAANDLATVARSSFDSDAIRQALSLNDEQEIIMSQAVGHPNR